MLALFVFNRMGGLIFKFERDENLRVRYMGYYETKTNKEVIKMARLNARELEWEKFEVFGIEGLFVDLRVDKNTVPDGYFMYEVRHCDDDWGEPCEVANWILVNFFGTLLVNRPLEDLMEYDEHMKKHYKYIEDEDDWGYLGECFEFNDETVGCK